MLLTGILPPPGRQLRHLRSVKWLRVGPAVSEVLSTYGIGIRTFVMTVFATQILEHMQNAEMKIKMNKERRL